MVSWFRKKSPAELGLILKNLGLTFLGTLVLAFGTAVFLVPFDLVAGGMSGIAIVLNLLIGVEFITVDLIVAVLSWVLFFAGLIFLGRSFALKTLVSTVVYPPALSLFMLLVSPDVLGGYFYLAGSTHPEIAFILASLVGGVLVGCGCALAFLGGGSTGGVDIFAFIICKAFPRLRSSRVIFFIDAAIVALGVFVTKNMIVSLLGIVTALVGSLVIDRLFLGGQRAFVASIISDKYEEINRLVIERLDRTTTITAVTGGYSGEGKHLITVSFTMREYAELISIINKADKSAFVTVHRAYEINGEGWTR